MSLLSQTLSQLAPAAQPSREALPVSLHDQLEAASRHAARLTVGVAPRLERHAHLTRTRENTARAALIAALEAAEGPLSAKALGERLPGITKGAVRFHLQRLLELGRVERLGEKPFTYRLAATSNG